MQRAGIDAMQLGKENVWISVLLKKRQLRIISQFDDLAIVPINNFIVVID